MTGILGATVQTKQGLSLLLFLNYCRRSLISCVCVILIIGTIDTANQLCTVLHFIKGVPSHQVYNFIKEKYWSSSLIIYVFSAAGEGVPAR